MGETQSKTAARDFVDKILSLNDRYDFSVTSWIRSPGRNALVGGHRNSKHLVGLACDIILSKPEEQEAFTAAAKGLAIKVVDEGDHLHVQTGG